MRAFLRLIYKQKPMPSKSGDPSFIERLYERGEARVTQVLEEFLKNPVYSRDYPPAKNLES